MGDTNKMDPKGVGRKDLIDLNGLKLGVGDELS
jgi:hypothetical protein